LDPGKSKSVEFSYTATDEEGVVSDIRVVTINIENNDSIINNDILIGGIGNDKLEGNGEDNIWWTRE